MKDAEIKRQIRQAAEAEERESSEHRTPADWLEALAPLGTDWHKEFRHRRRSEDESVGTGCNGPRQDMRGFLFSIATTIPPERSRRRQTLVTSASFAFMKMCPLLEFLLRYPEHVS